MASREALGARGMLNHGLADGRAQNFQRVNLTKPPPSLAHGVQWESEICYFEVWEPATPPERLLGDARKFPPLGAADPHSQHAAAQSASQRRC